MQYCLPEPLLPVSNTYFKILHPFNSKSIGDDVDFVHGHHKGQFVFVENRTGIKHIRHKSDGVHRSGSVHDIDDDGGQHRCEGFRNDRPAAKKNEKRV